MLTAAGVQARTNRVVSAGSGGGWRGADGMFLWKERRRCRGSFYGGRGFGGGKEVLVEAASEGSHRDIETVWGKHVICVTEGDGHGCCVKGGGRTLEVLVGEYG